MRRLSFETEDLDTTSDVRKALTVVAEATTVKRGRNDAVSLAKALSDELVRAAFGARQPIVLTFSEDGRSWQEIKYVDDDRARFEAAAKMLELLSACQSAGSESDKLPLPDAGEA